MHIDPGHAGEMRQNFGILVDLQILARAVALMGAHDRREGRHLGPAHDEFRRADISEKARVTADIRVMIRIAEEAGGQGGRDHGHETVVTREIHGLIASPQQRAMFLDPREPCPHEEQDVAGSPSFLDRARVDLRPERRPGVVHQPGIDTVGELHVDGKILAEIGHPPGEPEVDHVAADHALGKPLGGVGIGEVDDAAIEFAEIDERRLA